MKPRASGVLLHITSLPSPHGVGDLGPWAYRFADFLAQSRQGYWQMLPLNPTSTLFGNSPYSSPSAFAGNPLLISPELLVRDGWLNENDFEGAPAFDEQRVRYEAATRWKTRLLGQAYERFKSKRGGEHEFETFCRENARWLEDYSLFQALKARFREGPWMDWLEELRDRREKALRQWESRCRAEIEKERFIQYLFFKQWMALKQYCNGKKIQIIGDLPIYVNDDSADVWLHPEIFKLGADRRPAAIAGVPPDYFSATGQLWGNPVYDWQALQASGYQWWRQRMQHNLRCFDKVRLDHFRGFVAYWEVPAGEKTAILGQWVKAPAEDFFAAMARAFPRLPILAEDLGVITPDVRAVMEGFGFPGMKVLLFAFGKELPSHPYAPHNLTRNCAVYTGTHDNNTILGWWREETSPDDRRRLLNYIGREVPETELPWEMIRLALMSVAETAIVPMQDVLALGAEARMNRPSTVKGNWEWRLLPGQLNPSLSERLAAITELYGRAAE